MQTAPEIGQLAIVRKRPFVITEIIPSVAGLSGEGTRANHLISLSSVEDDGLGEELQVIWELEPGTTVHEKSALPNPNSFDHPKRLQAFLDAVRWGAISQADDKTLQSPFRSGIEVDEYQLDPVVRALSMPRVNLLIADDVGLGKTVEAGLVVQEMILRHRVRTVLIVCPSSLQIQWQEEMRDKFGLEFRIIDGEAISNLRRKRGIHVNPWSHFPRLITSIDFLKRERPLRTFRETLPAGEQPTYPRAYDLLIVDEAHNVAPSGRGKYATNSMRTMAIRSLAPHFEHKLFLSATPHNGYRESFAALLELLDSQCFARAVTPDRIQLDAVMVRRMKSELKLRWDGSRRFAERIVKHLEVAYSDGERHAHRALQQYSTLRLKHATSDGERMAAEFVLKLLKKRLFSSPAAFGITLEKHIATVGGRKTASTATRDIEDFSDDYADDDEYEAQTAEVVSSASQTLSPISAEETALLRQLREYAAKSSQRPDCKARTLIDWLKATLRPGGKWNDERLIIFTEYRATQKIWVARDLGYRGGRRTGVPLTDEVHLDVVGRLLGGISLRRATRGPAVAERTAAVVWKVLARIEQPVVLWNVFPFHPHEPDDPFSNRCHTAAERERTLPLLKILIDMFEPERLVAIGRDAQLALKDLDIPVTTVRHPSYGGQSEFMSGLFHLYGVAAEPEPQLPL